MKGTIIKKLGMSIVSLITALTVLTGCGDNSGGAYPAGGGGGSNNNSGGASGNNSGDSSNGGGGASQNGNGSQGELSIKLTVDKTDILINTTETVTFTAQTTGCTAASLSLSDEQGNEAAVLLDDGKGADKQAGDGIYTAAQEMSRTEVEQKDYCVILDKVRSNLCYVSFYKEITEAEWADFDTAVAEIQQIAASSAQNEQLLKDIEAYLINSGDFKNIKISGDTISAMSDCGVNFFYELQNENDTNKGGSNIASVYENKCNFFPLKENTAVSSKDKVDSILVVRPYSDSFTYTTYIDVANTIAASYGENATTVTVANRDQATVELLKTFDDYDIVLIDSHGAVSNGNPFLCTQEVYTQERLNNSRDYATGRIAVSASSMTAAVGFRFFEHYYTDNSLDGSCLYLGTCSSMINNTIAETFVNKGAEVVFGWSDIVNTTYDRPMLTSLFNSMLEGTGANDAMQEAMAANGAEDPTNPGTRICIYGDWDYTLPGKGIPDGTLRLTVTSRETGMPVSGAEVKLINSKGEATLTGTTDANGNYQCITSLTGYRVEVSYAGYETYISEPVQGLTNKPTIMNVVLSEALQDFTIPSALEIGLGANEEILVDCVPTGADRKVIRWSSSDSSTVSVLEQGIITGRKLGTAVITAEAEIDGETVKRECTVTVSNRSRDCVLVLDISGSMGGEPIRELKEAARTFCDYVIADSASNRVGIVTFASSSRSYPFTSDINELYSTIDGLSSGGGTDMDDGVRAAGAMLDADGRSYAEKNIIVMADGIPNSDSINPLYSISTELMTRYNMYSLGFYHENKSEEQEEILRRIQNDGYYEVVNGEDLAFAFGDIAGEINDGSKIVIRIACPVDVTITSNGQTLSSADENLHVADFGKIELFGQDKDIKIVTLDEGTDYSIDLNGTAAGTMDYSISHYAEDDSIVDTRTFTNVPLTNSTIIKTDSAIQENVSLSIDNDGDGVEDEALICGANEEISAQQPTDSGHSSGAVMVQSGGDSTTTVVIILISAAIVLVIIIVIVMASSKSKNNSSTDNGRGIQGENLTRLVEPPIQTVYVSSGELLIATGPMRTSVIKANDGELITIGKDTNKCNVILNDKYVKVSRMHCSVKFVSSADSYVVTDLSSTNGTYLSNGVRLKPNTPIYVKQGESITLGDKDCVIKLR